MVFFNILLLKKIYNMNKLNRDVIKMKRLKGLTISLLIISMTFLVIPASISFVYFSQFCRSSTFLTNILTLIDYLSFLNHSSLFFHCYITNIKFRSLVIKIINIIIGYLK